MRSRAASAAPTTGHELAGALSSRTLFYTAAGLLAAGMLLGGGGDGGVLRNFLVQVAGVVLLVVVASQPRLQTSAPRPIFVLLGLILITPAIQLIPLPPSWWTALPGRELLAASDQLLDGDLDWRPLSLDPQMTWLSGAYLLAPTAIFLAALRLSTERRWRLVQLLVAGAMLSLVLALLQIAAGEGTLHLFSSTHNAFPTGLFLNRNHQADILLIGMIFAGALIGRNTRRPPAARWTLWLAMVVVFSAGVIATMSRMGLLLLPVAILGSLVTAPRLPKGRSVMVVGAAAVGIVALIATSAGTSRVLDRFDGGDEERSIFWDGTIFAAGEYWPWGTGLGTFDVVYRSVENLDQVDRPYINAAHNDYLEVLMVAGVWGAALISAFLIFFVWATFRNLDRAVVPLRMPAAFATLILILHSIVDYPLRTTTLLTVFGLLVALLFPPPQGDVRAPEGPLNS